MTDKQYRLNLKTIEELIAQVEDPDTLIPRAQECIDRARKLLQECYACLRDELDNLKENDIRQ